MRSLWALSILTLAVFVHAHRTENAVPIVRPSEDENDNKNLSTVEKVSMKLDQENANRLKKKRSADKNDVAQGASKDMHIDNVHRGKDGLAYEINLDTGKSSPRQQSSRPKRTVAQATVNEDKQGISISNERRAPGGMSYSLDFHGDSEKPMRTGENQKDISMKDSFKRTFFSEGLVREPSERLRDSEEHPFVDKFRFPKPRFGASSEEPVDAPETRESILGAKPATELSQPVPPAFRSSELFSSEVNSAPRPFGDLFRPKPFVDRRSSEEISPPFGGPRPLGPPRPFTRVQPLDRIQSSSSSEEQLPNIRKMHSKNSWDRFPGPPESPLPNIRDLFDDKSDDQSSESTSDESSNTDQSGENNDDKVVILVVNAPAEPPVRPPPPPHMFRSSESHEFRGPHRGWDRHRWHHRRPQFRKFHRFGADVRSSSSSSESGDKSSEESRKTPVAHYETNYITNNIGVRPMPEVREAEGFGHPPMFGSVMQMAAPPTEKEDDPTLRKQIADNRFVEKEDPSEVVFVVADESETVDPQAFALNLSVGPMTLVVIFLTLLLFFFVHIIRRMLAVPGHNHCSPQTVATVPIKC